MNLETLEEENRQMERLVAVLHKNRLLRDELAEAGMPQPLAPRRLLSDLAWVIAEQHALTVDAITGPSRVVMISDARQHFMWAACQVKHPGGGRRWTDSAIGRFLNRSHATISHGVGAHVERERSRVADEMGLLEPAKPQAVGSAA